MITSTLKRWTDGGIIWEGPIPCAADAPESTKKGLAAVAAHKAGLPLEFANLICAKLVRANLSGANLSGANLSGAVLTGVNLRGALLGGADFSNAYLERAVLTGANLGDGLGVIPESLNLERLAAVAVAALAEPDALNMGRWHECETTHCIAGWGIYHAGELGQKLEAQFGPFVAGAYLLGALASVHFHDSNDGARVWLRQFLPTTKTQPIAEVYKEFSMRQERLGAEFEAAIFSDLESLYEVEQSK